MNDPLYLYLKNHTDDGKAANSTIVRVLSFFFFRLFCVYLIGFIEKTSIYTQFCSQFREE
jgi:hypothetical protein